MGEDEHAQRPGRLDEACCRDRLAGSRGMAEAEASARAPGSCSGGSGASCLFLTVGRGGEAVVLFLLFGLDLGLRGQVAVRERRLDLALVGGDQLGEHAGERVNLVPSQLKSRGEVRRLLREHPLEAEHQRVANLPVRRRRLVAALDLGAARRRRRACERCWERAPAPVPRRRAGRLHRPRPLPAGLSRRSRRLLHRAMSEVGLSSLTWEGGMRCRAVSIRNRRAALGELRKSVTKAKNS